MTKDDDTRIWFTQCVEQHMNALYGVALRLTGIEADAEDLVAESIIKAWSAIDSLQDRDRFRSWIFRIMHNRFISDYRKRSIRPQESSLSDVAGHAEEGELCTLLLEQPDEFLDWWADPERMLETSRLGEQISVAINALPEAFRVTVLLVNVDGLSYDEAALVLGVPPGTVRSRMKRGRTLLQKALWEQARDAGLGVQAPQQGT
jgi:RNA polymerase sigma-70 factor (ECF subfamily)